MTSSMKTVRRAVVRKGERPAATLTREPAGVTFAYLPDYDGPPVARTLPLDAPPVVSPSGAVPAFFAGLLPEGRRLSAVQRAAKTSADDDLTLVLMVGSDTVGDVTVTPEGTDQAPAPPALTASDLSAVRFADLLAEGGFVDRRAIPGMQDKLSTGMVTMPVRFAGHECIVKLDPPDYPDVVVNEDYFLGVARRLRLPVVQSQVVTDADGRSGLVVRRFDRVTDAAGVRKLAVEDATQLLGRYPADKYALSSEEVATAVGDACPARLVALRSVFQQFVLAWLTGNGDLHGKNVSVLQGVSGEWRVAPVYDVPSTLPYGDHSMALSLQGAAEGLSRRRFVAFGEALGLPTRAVESSLDEVLAVTEPMTAELDGGVLPWNDDLRRTVVRRLSRRRRDLVG